ncbi:hypothetical protein Tco_0448919, partial [Tanacetum coccineum]
FYNLFPNNLADWEHKAEAGTLLESDIVKREEWILDLHFFYQLERDYLKQKSRVKSAVKGDETTRYFDSLLRNHFASFSIKGIHVNGIWCENPALIKESALDHFALRFKESPEARPIFRSTLFRRLSPENASFLDSIFSVEEVKSAIWSCSGSKAQGPDGFNFNFIKAYWEVIKDDFIKSKVISSIIGPNQTALLAGRQILDGNLIANEVIRLAKLEAHQLLLSKVDFEKAFDSVNWGFLRDYADDALFFGKWSRLNARNLIVILKCFEEASCLKVNLSKSKLNGVCVSIDEAEAVASSLCCIHDSLLFTYLRLSVGKKMHLSDGWGEWKWRFLTEENALWRKVIKAFYGTNGGLNPHLAPFGSSGVCTSFWLDPWCDSEAHLRDLFSRLYALDTCQDCKVCDRWCVNDGVWGGTWSWRFPPRGRALDDLEALVSLIGNLSLSVDEDKWSWSRDAFGSFKVNICVWRASINRLATRTNLASRGCNIPFALCPFCLELVAARPPGLVSLFSIVDIAMGHVRRRGHLVLNKIINRVFQCALWAIWKWRNKGITSPAGLVAKVKDEDIFPSIQCLFKLWINVRYSSFPLNWNSWISRPWSIVDRSGIATI